VIVRNLVYHITRNANDVEDVTQDVFLKAYQAAAAFRGGSFRAYLARIARNHCYDLLRQRRARKDSESIEYVDETWASNAAGPEDIVVNREMYREMRTLMNTLKDVDREILFLRHVQQFTYEEIAGVVGLRTGTVRTRISRARQKLVELTEGREKDETSQLG
jgi:RNA polymerase sigma factor (sigma-70 family)